MTTSNILINSELDCKISNFKLFKLNKNSNLNSNFTTKTDVYFYGLVLYELISSQTSENNNDIQPFLRKFQASETDPFSQCMANISLDCIETNPNDRPSFQKIVEKFHSVLKFNFTPEIIAQTNDSNQLTSLLNDFQLEGWLLKKGNDLLGLWKKRWFTLKNLSKIIKKRNLKLNFLNYQIYVIIKINLLKKIF